MKKIFKYPIEANDYFIAELPEGAEILCAQTQGGVPFMWALVDPEASLVKRKFRVAGTGHPITESTSDMHYIGTFQLSGGGLIFHLFEVL